MNFDIARTSSLYYTNHGATLLNAQCGFRCVNKPARQSRIFVNNEPDPAKETQLEITYYRIRSSFRKPERWGKNHHSMQTSSASFGDQTGELILLNYTISLALLKASLKSRYKGLSVSSINFSILF